MQVTNIQHYYDISFRVRKPPNMEDQMINAICLKCSKSSAMQQTVFADVYCMSKCLERLNKVTVTLFATSILLRKDNHFQKLLLEIMVLLKLDFHLKYISIKKILTQSAGLSFVYKCWCLFSSFWSNGPLFSHSHEHQNYTCKQHPALLGWLGVHFAFCGTVTKTWSGKHYSRTNTIGYI